MFNFSIIIPPRTDYMKDSFYTIWSHLSCWSADSLEAYKMKSCYYLKPWSCNDVIMQTSVARKQNLDGIELGADFISSEPKL